MSTPQHQTNMAEYNAIVNTTRLLCDAITKVSNIDWFSQNLVQCHLISYQASNDIMRTSGRSDTEKFQYLLDAVIVQVQANPVSAFSKFVDILDSEAALSPFATMVLNTRGKFIDSIIIIIISYSFHECRV